MFESVALVERSPNTWQQDCIQMGELLWLTQQHPQHQLTPFADFWQRLEPFHRNGQWRMLRQGAQPKAWLAWAWLDDTQLQQALQGADIRMDNNGPHLWLAQWIAPFGCDAALAAAVAQLFAPVTQASWRVYDVSGTLRQVCHQQPWPALIDALPLQPRLRNVEEQA